MPDFNFDEIIDRRNTHCIKYDFAAQRRKPEGLLPMWVADMDFRVPEPVIEDLKKCADHGIFGYSEIKQPYYDTLSAWFERRFGFEVRREWVVKTPGVVNALALAVRAFSQPGDAVLIQNPVYYPFSQAIETNGRRVVNNALVYTDGAYHIDFDDFEDKIKSNRPKVFFLCSPHNPVGRVWTLDELTRMAEICLEYHCIIVADEIHCDFIYPGHTHHILPAISDAIADNCVWCTAPTKTFNLAGLQIANIVIPNAQLRKRFRHEIDSGGYSQLGVMGLVACESAYRNGDAWLDALKAYIYGNYVYVDAYIRERLPLLRLVPPEGTYLLWFDFLHSGIDAKQIDEFITDKAKLWLDDGHMFGEEGWGFTRMNIACPRSIIEEAMSRLSRAFDMG